MSAPVWPEIRPGERIASPAAAFSVAPESIRGRLKPNLVRHAYADSVALRIQPGAGGCTRRQRPTTSGAFTSSTHSLSDPSYTLTLRYPSKVRAKASRLAEIPPPQ